MTNDEPKKIWAQQTAGITPVSPEGIWKVAQASERFEHTIFWRDTREWIATIAVAGYFFYAAFSHETIRWLVLLAALIACLPMIYVTVLRRKRVRPEPSVSLVEYLSESIASVRQQIGLLRSVHWWYLAPITLSISLVFVDRRQWERGLGATLFFWGVGIVLFVGIWMLNQEAVRKNLLPRLRDLETTLAELVS